MKWWMPGSDCGGSEAVLEWLVAVCVMATCGIAACLIAWWWLRS